jgi:hypothetical protein
VLNLGFYNLYASKFHRIIRGVKMLDWSDRNCDRSAVILLARIEGVPSVLIDWNGIPLECGYEWEEEEPGTMVDPWTPEYFAVVSAVTAGGVDLMHEYEGERICDDITLAVKQHLGVQL